MGIGIRAYLQPQYMIKSSKDFDRRHGRRLLFVVVVNFSGDKHRERFGKLTESWGFPA
jgi:hypothetical protein